MAKNKHRGMGSGQEQAAKSPSSPYGRTAAPQTTPSAYDVEMGSDMAPSAKKASKKASKSQPSAPYGSE